jgi:CheY-like chemotaxis protein
MPLIPKSLRSIPIIAVTSYALSGEGQKARVAGCDDYVPKPFSPRQLLAKIGNTRFVADCASEGKSPFAQDCVVITGVTPGGEFKSARAPAQLQAPAQAQAGPGWGFSPFGAPNNYNEPRGYYRWPSAYSR